MADVAQLVRALVCGTRCRRFESDHPPHKKTPFCEGVFFILIIYYLIYDAFNVKPISFSFSISSISA